MNAVTALRLEEPSPEAFIDTPALTVVRSQERFHQIDLARFVAALAVLGFHYLFRGYAGDNMSLVAFPEAVGVAKYGYLGVELFFMISGFVILLTAMGKSPAQFARSRVLRLYPAFWIGCTLTFACTLLLGGGVYHATWKEFFVNLTMTSEFVGVAPMDGAYWSLFVEMRFYLLVFLILLLGLLRYTKVFLWLWLLGAYAMVYHSIAFFSDWFIVKYCGFFIAGATFYLMRRERITWDKLLLVAATVPLAFREADLRAAYVRDALATDVSLPLIYATILVFYGFFFLVVGGRLDAVRGRWCAAVGALTYPLYLIHENVGFMLINAMHFMLNRWVLVALVTLLVLAAATLIAHWAEPAIAGRLKKLLTPVRRPAPAPLVEA